MQMQSKVMVTLGVALLLFYANKQHSLFGAEASLEEQTSSSDEGAVDSIDDQSLSTSEEVSTETPVDSAQTAVSSSSAAAETTAVSTVATSTTAVSTPVVETTTSTASTAQAASTSTPTAEVSSTKTTSTVQTTNAAQTVTPASTAATSQVAAAASTTTSASVQSKRLGKQPTSRRQLIEQAAAKVKPSTKNQTEAILQARVARVQAQKLGEKRAVAVTVKKTTLPTKTVKKASPKK